MVRQGCALPVSWQSHVEFGQSPINGMQSRLLDCGSDNPPAGKRLALADADVDQGDSSGTSAACDFTSIPAAC